MGKTDITPKEMKDVISGKLSRYFGVSIKEASTEQLYKAVVMAVRDILLEKRNAGPDLQSRGDERTRYHAGKTSAISRRTQS